MRIIIFMFVEQCNVYIYVFFYIRWGDVCPSNTAKLVGLLDGLNDGEMFT